MFLFSKKARAQRLQAQQESQQQSVRAQYWNNYQTIKVLMLERRPLLAQTAYPTLTADDAEKVAVIASNLMTAEPKNSRAMAGASSRILEMAAELRASSMTGSAELRNMAVTAALSSGSQPYAG